MKARRRHQLQENVLAIELGKIAEFLRRRGSYLATGLLIAAVIVLVIVYFWRQSQTKQLWAIVEWDRVKAGRVAPDQLVGVLTNLAEQSDNDRIAALAGVELGYEYARRLLHAQHTSERLALLEKAQAWYSLTIQKFPRQKLAVAKAHLGLGKLAETARQWNVAAEHYRRVTMMSDLAGQPVVQLAEAGLRQLNALKEPVRMATSAPATKPVPRPASAPATRPTPGPTTRPAGEAPK